MGNEKLSKTSTEHTVGTALEHHNIIIYVKIQGSASSYVISV